MAQEEVLFDRAPIIKYLHLEFILPWTKSKQHAIHFLDSLKKILKSRQLFLPLACLLGRLMKKCRDEANVEGIISLSKFSPTQYEVLLAPVCPENV